MTILFGAVLHNENTSFRRENIALPRRKFIENEAHAGFIISCRWFQNVRNRK